jgi:hypothetical protein
MVSIVFVKRDRDKATLLWACFIPSDTCHSGTLKNIALKKMDDRSFVFIP